MEQQNTNPQDRILRLADVKARTGLSRSTIYLNISKGHFPKHFSLGGRCVGWLESEINAWIASCVVRNRQPSEDLAQS